MKLRDETAKAVREEIVRQYRDGDRGKCPAGAAYYEEHIGPSLVADAVLSAIEAAGMIIVPREPTNGMIMAGIIERHETGTPEAWKLATANIYRAMLTAASQDGEEG